MTHIPTPEEVVEYVLLVGRYDYSHEFSDDPLAWTKGREQWAEIQRLQPTCDPGWKIFSASVPEFFRRKP
jgi:hypothetical protein